jgi:DNA polymerase-3 subunit delta
MKIPPSDIENFINNKLNIYKAILIYGPDNGLTKERSKLIANKIIGLDASSFDSSYFSFDKIKEDVSLVANALFSRSLTKKKQLVKITDAGTSLPKNLLNLIESYRGNNILLIEAGDLTPTSSLRKFFDTNKNLASLACYHDEKFTVKKIIQAKLKSHNINIEAQALQLTENALAGDRMLILAEIDKLITYMGDEKQVDLKDILAIIDDENTYNIDNLCNAICDRDIKNISPVILSLTNSGTNMIGILRMVSRYFSRLYQVKLRINYGETIEKSMSELAPPVFFKQIDNFKKHVTSWSLEQLSDMIATLLDMEIKSKKTNIHADLLVEYKILELVGCE